MNQQMLKEALTTYIDSPNDPTSGIYFYPKSEKFLIKDGRGKYIEYKQAYLRKKLESQGFEQNQITNIIYDIQTNQVIDGYFEVAGQKTGVQEISDQRILIHREQKRIPLVKGDWPTVKAVLLNMLGEDQFEWFLAWLSVWAKAYYSYSWSPGQVLVLIGEPAAGKSLIQRYLSKLFGDKTADPIAWMTGQSEFNYELASSPHLAIEDRFADSSKKVKDAIREHCKDIAVNEFHRFRGMYKEAVMLSPLWRATISCNPTEESMAVIPPIEEATKNKVSLLWCSKHNMPMPTNTHDDKKKFMKQLMDEAPMFLNFLVNEISIDEKFKCPENRMGVSAYHHPKALSCAEEASYCGQKMQLIQETLSWFRYQHLDNHEVKDHFKNDIWKGKPGEILAIFDLRRNFKEFRSAESIGRVLANRANLGSGEVVRHRDRSYSIELRSHDTN